MVSFNFRIYNLLLHGWGRQNREEHCEDLNAPRERATAAQLANFHNYESNDNSHKKKASDPAI